ncbi:putative short chain dehydrogenase/reductase [Amycolatopsis sp. NBRC 101858]|uniref:SDR family oxidoreductase n=1 Tax=Amycolatopsis sp. NBRC 101858 TaxID=3032200 RepID=UPI0024A0FAB7|nr:SDR family oxidoreductase [Amycolatopsis sp. NBRC 101858]GLY34063.1 putative short chain dehydrogenase/reductase [Amycolatopsis sp. NBRC 101858]
MRYPAIEVRGAVVAITGGARGIGRATAAEFAARGATVCVGDLDATSEVLPLDVTNRESFDAFTAAVTERFGRIDVLVNNAGVMPLGDFLEEPDSVGRTTLDVNVLGLVHGLRSVLPGMIARGRGHVVNVASMAGKIPLPGMAVYNASKFAAVGLTAAVRREYAASGVSLSAVLPSAVRTELASGVRLGGALPTVDPEDVAKAIVGTLRTRRAETAVPRWLAGWDLLAALVPEGLMTLARKAIGDDRALTELDSAARAAYVRRVGEQVQSHSQHMP